MIASRLGDLAPVPVDRGVDRLGQGGDQERRQVPCRAGRTGCRTGPSGSVGPRVACHSRFANLASSQTCVLPISQAPMRPPLAVASLPPTYRINAIKSIIEARYPCQDIRSKSCGQLPLPVRCQPPQIVLEFRCRPARSKCIKDLISRIFWTLEGPFFDAEIHFSPVGSGTRPDPS